MYIDFYQHNSIAVPYNIYMRHTPDEQEFLAQLAQTLHNIITLHSFSNRQILQAQHLIEKMSSAITLNYNLDQLFDYMSSGVFKECYESGVDGWIIKFANAANSTEEEKYLLSAANEAGVGEIFVPTYFLELPCQIFTTYLEEQDDDDDDNSRWVYRDGTYIERSSYISTPSVKQSEILAYCILQPEVSPIQTKHLFACCGSKWRVPCLIEKYLENPLFWQDGTLVSHKEAYTDIDCPNHFWLQSVINYYGDDYFRTWSKFCNAKYISDLHNANIGYFGEQPIIFDWMSS